jgi:hypothetical protein
VEQLSLVAKEDKHSTSARDFKAEDAANTPVEDLLKISNWRSFWRSRIGNSFR